MVQLCKLSRFFREIHLNNKITNGTILSRFYGTSRDPYKICLSGLLSALSVKKKLTVKDWKIFRELYDSRVLLNSALSVFKSDCSLNDFKNFLESFGNEELPLVFRCLSLSVYSRCKNECSDKDRKTILCIYKEVVGKYPVLTEEMIESLLSGVALTSSWKRYGMDLLEKWKKLKVVPSGGYALLIGAAFSHDNPGTGWKLINEVLGLGGTLYPQIYHDILDHFERKSNPPKTEDVMKLIELLEKQSLMPTEDVAMRLCAFFEDSTRTWVGRLSNVSLGGVCSCCSSKLKKLDPSKSEMKKLAESVLSDVLQENNEFLNSSPGEIARFIRFLNGCRFYNVVLDGLNITLKQRNREYGFKQLISMTYSLKRNGYSVMVVGRKHLLGYFKGRRLPPDVQWFLAEDSSKDDPFAIYAAVQNGPGTYLVSNDFMGLHFSKLNSAMQIVFRKWQFSSHVLSTLGHELIFPQYTPICQSSEDGQVIHVPFSTSKFVFSPSGWLCLQQVSTSQKEKADMLWPKESVAREDKNLSRTFRGYALKVLYETNDKVVKGY